MLLKEFLKIMNGVDEIAVYDYLFDRIECYDTEYILNKQIDTFDILGFDDCTTEIIIYLKK